MDFFKTITGKVVGGLVSLAVVTAAISWWRTDPQIRQRLIDATGRISAWAGVVLALPWATFFLIGRVGRLESNLAGAILVAMYTLAELLLLGWLFGWSVPGAAAWTFVLLGGLIAAAYNLLTCDWIAERLE